MRELLGRRHTFDPQRSASGPVVHNVHTLALVLLLVLLFNCMQGSSRAMPSQVAPRRSTIIGLQGSSVTVHKAGETSRTCG
ncbi:hypothetical protein PsYK624_006200 [Phanerochaete sordida]|uniref:Uncharacterized protein n=1 Tax=Phanerochaete sordida TaxID=48140 RepID=A0A9P3FYK5_9APHY|nr:hypothetical protein PsYK624_006200 [Phanerochaete sordida]